MKRVIGDVGLGLAATFLLIWRTAALFLIVALAVSAPFFAARSGNIAYLGAWPIAGVWGYWWWETRYGD